MHKNQGGLRFSSFFVPGWQHDLAHHTSRRLPLLLVRVGSGSGAAQSRPTEFAASTAADAAIT